MVHVISPATLPEGYTFEAQVGGDAEKTFTVEVPPGGVKEGDTFLAPLPESFDGPRLKAPTGRWKDGLFDFLSLGCCHPHFCCALWCTQIAMAQVMTRLQLTWLGDPGPAVATRNTFFVVLVLVVSYTTFSLALGVAGNPYDVENVPPAIPILKALASFFFLFWSIYALCRTRENVRVKYSIPEERCEGCEDVCCAAFCSCCSVAQIARHTGEYETYKGACFTASGLEEGAPLVV